MINKKKVIKCLIILILIIIIIIAAIQIRSTLARYETTTTATTDVDVAFWVVDNDFKSDRILIENIYPSSIPHVYKFTVSNFDPGDINDTTDDKIAETDIEYEIVLTTTTNLPLNYSIERNGSLYTPLEEKLFTEEQTVYKEIKFGTSADPYPLELDTIKEDSNGDYVKNKVTDEYILNVEFPASYASNLEYVDTMEDIKINLIARQKIN